MSNRLLTTGHFKLQSRKESDGAVERRGPPNRMNDLTYRDWVKFQKSFFWYESSQALVQEFIEFFTKAKWAEGRPSRILIVDCPEFDAAKVSQPRIVDVVAEVRSHTEYADRLEEISRNDAKYDFILVDLRRSISNREGLAEFLKEAAPKVFSSVRQLLLDLRYCVFLVDMEGPSGAGFPIPWSIAQAGRNFLRLRDEKIGLVREKGQVFYCVVMQADNDGRQGSVLTPKSIRISKQDIVIPAWTFPKASPRDRNEVLHPAKYPEILVTDLIDLFTKPNDVVFDPMMGIGSTIIAVMRTKRHGYGLDLSSKFVAIAKSRIARENPPALLEELRINTKAEVFQGDATRLAESVEMRDVRCHYVVTSPPYWSILVYSDDTRDLGNVKDYDSFLEMLVRVYNDGVAEKLTERGYLTVVVKNVKRNHVVYPLAWDLVERLAGRAGQYEYVGTTLWCQDDIRLKLFAFGVGWISNTHHQYCLHFRKRRTRRASCCSRSKL